MSELHGSAGGASPVDESLPPWAYTLLQQPGESREASRAAIMAAVRAVPGARRGRAGHLWRAAMPMRPSRWPRRGLLTPVGAMAAVFAAVVSLQSMRGLVARGGVALPGLQSAALLIGDTVVMGVAGASSSTYPTTGSTATRGNAPSGGSLRGAMQNVRDTMRIVEFVLRGSGVTSARVVGDFNAWRSGATVLALASDGAWRARVLVPRDIVKFAYEVDRDRDIRARPTAGGVRGGAAAGTVRTSIDSI